MKKIYFIIMLLLGTLTASAQPSAFFVEPGSKGPLPEVTPVPGFAEEGRFGALFMTNTLSSDYNSFSRGHYLINLIWWSPLEFGGDYYTLEYRFGTNGEWMTQKDNEGKIVEYDNTSYGTSYDTGSKALVQFRLVMHGGDLDGYVSNVVSGKTSSIFTAYGGYGSDNEPWYNIVGQTLGGGYNLIVRAWDRQLEKYTEYTREDSVYNYSWFRVNPTTREETRIEGATGEEYTPTTEDIGYWLYCEISGDGEHCDFVYRYLPCSANPMVCLPVQASPGYFGADGFVLNTDYVLPSPEKNLYMQRYEYDEETGTGQEVMEALGQQLSVRKPGQYAVRMTEDMYMYNMVFLSEELASKGYVLTFVYEHGYYDENDEYVPSLWYRECQLMADRYTAPLDVLPVASGRPVPTTVDIIGENIDGNLEVKASATLEDNPEDAVIHFENVSNLIGCYVKARRTQGTLDTYYPNTLLWTEATPVKPEYDEDWNTPSITIEVQPEFSLLTGNGTIEGTIYNQGNEVKSYTSARKAEGEETSYTVYLRENGGSIVASTQTDATGAYRFTNVPYATYQVLVNIDGYTQEQPIQVTLSSDNPTVTGIDYDISGTEIVDAIHHVSAGLPDTQGSVYSLDGRRVAKPSQPGIYIRGGKKIIIKD